MLPRKRSSITAVFRGNCTAFIPRQLTAPDLDWLKLPRALAGFPTQLTYRDVRPGLTGGSRIFVAEYRAQGESFVQADACRKLTYRWVGGGEYHVDVLHDGVSGRWSVYKFKAGKLVSQVAGEGFGEAMIRATAFGLDRQEPAFTFIGEVGECQAENRAQAARAHAAEMRARARQQQDQPPDIANLRAQKLAFGMVSKSGESANLVFIPLEIAADLADIHRATKAASWGEFKVLMPAARLRPLMRKMKEVYGWQSFDDYYEERRASGTRAERESLWLEWCASPNRAPLDEDRFKPDQIPGYRHGDWPERAEQTMLSWLPTEIGVEFGTTETSALHGDFLRLDTARVPEILEALERAGYECVCQEELVRKACGYPRSSAAGE